MAQLGQLLDGERYRPCEWDLRADAAGREYWAGLFRWHLEEVVLPLIRPAGADADGGRCAAFRAEYHAALDDVSSHPERYERLDILLFTEVREGLLARHGFADPFGEIKRHENEVALQLLPELLAELHAATPADRRALLAAGLLAGNIFDLGARATINRHRDGNSAFHGTRATLPPRPWLRDDLDAWWRRWETAPPYRHVVFFVDNAGSDIVLGCVPLALWMVAHGARVTLAANSRPVLNDITAAELGPLLEQCGAVDRPLAEAVRDGRLRVAATGSTAPLVDLTRLSANFVAATRNADLLILHGMGRAIESNFHVRFGCDTLWSAVIKDEAVARRVGGKLFDCVFRFEAAAG